MANNLRYIAYDFIASDEARQVIEYLFHSVGHGFEVHYPGLEFGLDSDEGRALLETPLRIGVAWMLADRVENLGRREPRLRVFTREDYYICMLWDLGGRRTT